MKCLYFLLLVFLVLPARTFSQEPTKDFVHLTTLWNAPGTFVQSGGISPKKNFLAIYDETEDVTRLVEIATGKIIVEVAGNSRLNYTPDEKLVIAQRFIPPYESISMLIEIKSGNLLAEIPGYFDVFSANKELAVIVESRTEPISRLVNLETSSIVTEIPGYFNEFSTDDSLFTTVVPNEDYQQTQVINRATNEIVFEVTSRYADLECDCVPFPMDTYFTKDGKYLAVYSGIRNTTRIYEMNTWEQVHEVDGGVSFSPDMRYMINVISDWYDHVNLYRTDTWEVIREVEIGSFWFSESSKYLFELTTDANCCSDNGIIRIIDLESGQVLREYPGFSSVGLVKNETEVYVFSNSTHRTQFFDLKSGELLREVDGWVTDMGQGMKIVEDWETGFDQLIDVETGEILLSSYYPITATEKYIFVTNGLFVDVYGRADQYIETMQPPRRPSGMGRTQLSPVNLYSYPDMNSRVLEELPTDKLCNVLGQAAGTGFVYVHCYRNARSGDLKYYAQGWLMLENLSVIETWENTPFLAPGDPIGGLRRISAIVPR